MKIKQGANVVTVEGEEAGKVDRVVLDPRNKEVTHLVVQKGMLFKEDKVVPLDLVEEVEEDKVIVRAGQEVFDSLSDFTETHYVRLDEDELSRTAYPEGYATPIYFYPTAGVMHPETSGYYGAFVPSTHPHYQEEEEVNIPPQTIAVKEGAKVISEDDKHVGDLEQVVIDRETDRLTNLVLSKGLLGKKKKLIPVSWIHSVSEDEVRLVVGASVIERLSEYEE